MIGLMKPDIGEIWINEQMINRLSLKELQKIRAKIGMVFQFGALFDFMSVINNLALPLKKLTDYSNEEIVELSEKALKEVGLEGVGNLMPSELSGGMKKRVSIARAIVSGPNYILYDEPTTGLDPIMTDSINKLIKKIHIEENLTSIIVTHEMRTVYTVANRVLFLDDGLIKYDGTPQNMKNSDNKTILQFLAGSSSLS
jgi:phospholipid/cholesterol/gamma-HCH transport system ATP-binding protein